MISRLFFVLLFSLHSALAFGDQQPVTIGLSLSLSGKYAAMGTMQQKGFLLWERHVNEDGGLIGRKVQVLFEDDHSQGPQAKEIYRKMIEEQKLDFVFGPYSSGISEAILPITEKNGYPVLLSGASADKLWEKGYRCAFGVYTPAGKYTVGFLQMLVQQKIKQVAIVMADDPFSLSLAENTEKWAKKFRLKVVMTERFIKGTPELAEIAKRVRASHAQALIVCGHLEESVVMRKALKGIDWYPRAYYASVGPATEDFYQRLGTDANLAFSSSQWEKEVGVHFQNGKRFVREFHELYGAAPSYHAATAYAAGMILEAAVKKTASLDRKKLRDTLAAMDTMTLIGRYGVDNSGRQIRHFPLVIQWQEGRKNVVWPENLKESDPIFP